MKGSRNYALRVQCPQPNSPVLGLGIVSLESTLVTLIERALNVRGIVKQGSLRFGSMIDVLHWVNSKFWGLLRMHHQLLTALCEQVEGIQRSTCEKELRKMIISSSIEGDTARNLLCLIKGVHNQLRRERRAHANEIYAKQVAMQRHV